MYVSVHHIITDSEKWEQVTRRMTTLIDERRLPEGLKGLMFLPGTDGSKADCVWEAQSLDALRNFLDREIGTAAMNDYFQINSAAAFGLPVQEELRKAA